VRFGARRPLWLADVGQILLEVLPGLGIGIIGGFEEREQALFEEVEAGNVLLGGFDFFVRSVCR
jgi:hypothetical protein